MLEVTSSVAWDLVYKLVLHNEDMNSPQIDILVVWLTFQTYESYDLWKLKSQQDHLQFPCTRNFNQVAYWWLIAGNKKSRRKQNPNLDSTTLPWAAIWNISYIVDISESTENSY